MTAALFWDWDKPVHCQPVFLCVGGWGLKSCFLRGSLHGHFPVVLTRTVHMLHPPLPVIQSSVPIWHAKIFASFGMFSRLTFPRNPRKSVVSLDQILEKHGWTTWQEPVGHETKTICDTCNLAHSAILGIFHWRPVCLCFNKSADMDS